MEHSSTPVRDESQQWKMYTTLIVLMFFMVITTALRICSRLLYRGSLTTDDWFALLGTSLNMVGDGFGLYAVQQGFGRHSKFLSLEAHIDAVKYVELTVLIAALAIWSVKISVGFFLLSLLQDTHKQFRRFVWGLMAFTTATTFVGVLLWGLQARPINKLWDPRVKGTRRSSHDFLNAAYVFFAFTAFTDLVYSLTPIWYLWNVQISRRKKHAIWAIMGSGILLTGTACACIAFSPRFLLVKDITWNLVPLWITDCIQRQLSSIIANLPAVYTMVCKQLPPTSTMVSGSASRTGTSSKMRPRGIVRQTNINVMSKSRDDDDGLDSYSDDYIPLRDRHMGAGAV